MEIHIRLPVNNFIGTSIHHLNLRKGIILVSFICLDLGSCGANVVFNTFDLYLISNFKSLTRVLSTLFLSYIANAVESGGYLDFVETSFFVSMVCVV